MPDLCHQPLVVQGPAGVVTGPQNMLGSCWVADHKEAGYRACTQTGTRASAAEGCQSARDGRPAALLGLATLHTEIQAQTEELAKGCRHRCKIQVGHATGFQVEVQGASP